MEPITGDEFAVGLKPGMGSNPFSGYGDANFGPLEKITREQAMAMIVQRLLQKSNLI